MTLPTIDEKIDQLLAKLDYIQHELNFLLSDPKDYLATSITLDKTTQIKLILMQVQVILNSMKTFPYSGNAA